jgi:hypothetical protein
MAKKSILLLIIMAVCGTAVFAQEKTESASGINWGVGGFIGGDFGGGVKGTISNSAGSGSVTAEMPYFGGGAYAFLDSTYLEGTFAVYGGEGKYKVTGEVNGQQLPESSETDVAYTNLNVGLFVKYPIKLDKSFSLFPLLGAEYNSCLFANENEKLIQDSDYFSTTWFKFGGGLDVALAEKVYLRFEALYGLRFLAQKLELHFTSKHGS